MTVKPRQPAPALEVKLLDRSSWRLGDAKSARFEMVVFYRGLHCSICKTYLGDLDSKLPEFTKRGVEVIAVSMDDIDRGSRAKAEWGINNLRIGCDLTLATAREWELYISTPVREGEPALFSEPGLFLIKADGTIFYSSRTSAPWGRPPFEQIWRGLDIATERKTAARGEA